MIVNVTVLAPARAGSIAVFPGDTAWNGSASISFAAGQTKQSMITAKLGADGTLAVRNNIARPIQVIGDVVGYYAGGTPEPAPGAFQPIPHAAGVRHPGRRLPPAGAGQGDPDADHRQRWRAGHRGGGRGGNLTVISPARAGSVSTYPCDAGWDGSASVSFAAGRSEQDVLAVGLGDVRRDRIRDNASRRRCRWWWT